MRCSLRAFARHKSTLLRLPRQSTQSKGDGLPCVYITGFRSESAKAEDWGAWHNSHERLVAMRGWEEESFGCSWRTGAAGDALGRWPLPIQAATMLARRSSPALLAAATAGDGLAHAARLYLQFREAERAALKDAPLLAAECSHFQGDFRVVAFSLGCRLALEALPRLPPSQRPVEVHLCAAAVTEEYALPHLPDLCSPRGRTFHYHSASDEGAERDLKPSSERLHRYHPCAFACRAHATACVCQC